MQVLVTGATGNIGSAVVRHLFLANANIEVFAGVRSIEQAQRKFKQHANLEFIHFDFEDAKSFDKAFHNIDILFLLRPPHIANIKKYFKPLLTKALEKGIKKIVFLSVQGVEQSQVIPHHKIEGLIKTMNFEYIFVRPSYFMQNLTTTFKAEIQQTKTLVLPSANAKFNWIDVDNIGEFTAQVITNFEQFKNKAFDLTGTESRSFKEVCALMSQKLNTSITYKSINPLAFYLRKKKQGLPSNFALVMTLLHTLPRVQKLPALSSNYQNICGKAPTTLETFVEREKGNLQPRIT